VATAFQPNAFQPNAFQIDGGASFGDGALSATGTGTALFVGASTAVAPFSITGTGTATLSGASTAASTLFADAGCDTDELLLNDGTSFVLLNDGASLLQINSGSPQFVGSGLVSGALSAAGTGTGLFVGAPFASGVLSATGTGTATFVGVGVNPAGALAATGTGTGLFVSAPFASGLLSATGTGTASFAGVGISANGALSATGTGTAAFVSASSASSALSARGGLKHNNLLLGDGTSRLLLGDNVSIFQLDANDAYFSGASVAGGALSATGSGSANLASPVFDAATVLAATGTVTTTFAGDYDAFNCGLLLNDGSYVLLSDGVSAILINDDSCLVPPAPFSDGALSVSGSGAAAFVGSSQTGGALSVSGSAAATFVGFGNTDGALAASGSATVSFVGDFAAAGYNCGLLLNDGTSFVLLNDDTSVFLLNDDTCLVPPDGTPDVVEPPVVLTDNGGVAAPGAWRVRKKKKKKDELDDLIAQLKEQVVPWREAQVGAQIQLLAEINHAEAITLDNTLAQIEAEIANLKEVMAEIDDEEAILLLM
jgi:hypothetical protein